MANECERTPWSEELDGKELHGALDGECDLELFLYIVALESTHLPPSRRVVLC